MAMAGMSGAAFHRSGIDAAAASPSSVQVCVEDRDMSEIVIFVLSEIAIVAINGGILWLALRRV